MSIKYIYMTDVTLPGYDTKSGHVLRFGIWIWHRICIYLYTLISGSSRHSSPVYLLLVPYTWYTELAGPLIFRCLRSQCRIYVSVNRVSIGSDNGFSPTWHQAIIWTNAGLLSIGPLGTNFSEILIGIQNFSYKKMHLKMPSANMATILSRGRWDKPKGC